MKSFCELKKVRGSIEIKLAMESYVSAESEYVLYLSVYGFCIDITEDGLNTYLLTFLLHGAEPFLRS